MTNLLGHLPPLGAIAALQKLMEHFPGRAVIIGAIATSLLGRPRLTADMDALFTISMDELGDLVRISSEEGFHLRLNDAEDFARKSRMLLLQHNETETNLDIAIGMLPFEYEMIERSKSIEVESLRLTIPAPEDLIIIKAIANRPKDIEDIQSILHTQQDLDLVRVISAIKEFAALLDTPAIWTDIASYFPE